MLLYHPPPTSPRTRSSSAHLRLRSPPLATDRQVCRDKKQKWSPNGKSWRNFSAWTPNWSAVCWFDIVLIRRTSAKLIQAMLAEGSIANHGGFCRRLSMGWYPTWIHQPAPPNLKCAHRIARPEHGQICDNFLDGDDPANKAYLARLKLPERQRPEGGKGKGKGKGKGMGVGKGLLRRLLERGDLSTRNATHPHIGT